MTMSTRKRFALGAGATATVGAVATLAAGVTFGLFSATTSSGANTFTAGTVTVGNGPTSVTCNVQNMVPGDSSANAPGSKADGTCTYNVVYTGSANAYLAVDVAVSNGTTKLYDASATGLQLYLKDGSSTPYVSGTSFSQQGGASASLPSTGTTPNLLVNKTAAGTGTAVSFSLDYGLPTGADNSYQGGNTTVTLTFHAVQAGNNAVPSNCATGQQCNVGSTFAWS